MKSTSAGPQKSGPWAAGNRAGVIVLQQLASTNQNNDQPVVAAGVFRPIDTARIARELKIEAVARDRGRHNLPETGDNNLDALEQKIIQTIDGERAWQGRELLNSLRAYAAQLVSYSVPEEFPKLQIHAKHALASLSVAAGRAVNDLLPLQKRYVAARDALEEFRSRNHLSRSARDPARGWSTLGLLFIFVAMESMLTGFFFTNGREFGLVDAIRMAVEISLMNVAFSFLLGLGPCRWRNHRRSFVSTSGPFVTLAGIAFIVALHLFAAHLRVATPLGGEGKAFASILGSIQRAFWARPDMASFCLLGMSLVIAFGAIWKGYVFDDPYPRYGATHRRAKAAREEYQKAHFDLFDELGEVEEESVDQLNAGIANLPAFPQMAIDVRAERAAMLNGFRAYEMAVETAANQLLRLYRDINHAQRTTAPPSHFTEKWKLPCSFLMSFELKALLADPEVGDVASSLTKLQHLSNAIITQYELLHDRYPHPLEMN